jgi:hypothetical protein
VSFGSSTNGLIVGERDTNTCSRDGYGVSAILRTVDGGKGWIRVPFSERDNLLFGVSFGDANTAFAVGKWGTIIRSTDGGQHWDHPAGVLPSDSSGGTISVLTRKTLLAVSFLDANRGVAVGDSGLIFQTTNGGANWAMRPSGTACSLRGVWLVDANVGYVVGDSMTILQTINGGSTWHAMSGGSLNSLYAIAFIDSKTGTIVGEGGTILNTISAGSIDAVKDERLSLPPTQIVLSQNYPNPFNPTTAISYQLLANSFVTLGVFDLLGREVATLVNGRESAGTHEVMWNASQYPSGVYFYRLQSNGMVLTKKLLFLK